MSEVRLGPSCILVRRMFRYRQLRQTEMQDLRRQGHNASLPELTLP
jgi:hypothetical protein